MKTITKEYQVYTYDELSEEAKEKVRNSFGINDSDIETDTLKDGFKYLIEEKYPYFEDTDFIWSLGNSQGDGLSFSSTLNLKLFIEKELPNLKHKKAMTELVFSVISRSNRGNYCYASESDIDFEYNYTNKSFDHLEKLFNDEVLPVIQKKYMEVCSDLERKGYAAYDYLYSDENARENSEANDYTYLKNGEMFNV